ncbi:hypothetical protein F4774DRAFT_423318 [Daldinia eschscholtzii]|nr:hypothetical protein F4774DRAFT_423318 [Daldinia eschscholtzii]
METGNNLSLDKGASGRESPFSAVFQVLLSSATKTAGPTPTSHGGPSSPLTRTGLFTDLRGDGTHGQPVKGGMTEDSCSPKQENTSLSLDGIAVPTGVSQNTAPFPLPTAAPGGGAIAPHPSGTRDTQDMHSQATTLGHPLSSRSNTIASHDAAVVSQGMPSSMLDQNGNLRSVESEHLDNIPSVDGKFITPAMILSQECQKRRFNPQFKELHDGNGRFKCSVNLRGLVVADTSTYNNPFEAKSAISKKALLEVRKLPCEDPAYKPAAILTKVVKQGMYAKSPGFRRVRTEKKTSLQQRRNDQRTGVTPLMQEHRVNRYQPPSDFSIDLYDSVGLDSDQDFWISQVQQQFGHANGPSNRIAQDPLAARAFLEGMALGVRLGQSSIRHPEAYTNAPFPVPRRSITQSRSDSDRYRERSPATGRMSRYARVRSPIHRDNN